jgi:HEAT repeat protein
MIELATAAFVALFAVAVGLALSLVVARLWWVWRGRVLARRAAGPRRRLIAFLAEPDEPGALAALVDLPRPAWRAIEPTAVTMLGQVRGEAHTALAAVFLHRGLAGQAVRDLRRRVGVRRGRAAELLGALRRHDAVPALTGLLADRDPQVRLAAVRALGRIGDPAAALPLLDTVAGAHPAPSHIVAQALAGLGPAASPILLAALDRDEALVRATALDALRLLDTVGTATRVAAVLRDDQSLPVRRRAAQALGRSGGRAALAHLVEAAEPDQPPALRADAVRALGELGAAAAVPRLVDLVRDPDFEVAHEAAAALVRSGPAGRAALVELVDRAPAGAVAAGHAGAAGDDIAARHAAQALAMAELTGAATPVAAAR